MNGSKFVADNSSSVKATNCLSVEPGLCDGSSYADHYDDASASLVVLCAILLFFMRSGFLYVELAFSMTHKRKRVVLAKYCDLFAGTLGFWLFGFAISGSTDTKILGAEQDFLFWFLRFMFATNAATILGGTLVGQEVEMRTVATFIYGFVMTGLIHPGVANFFWSLKQSWLSDTAVFSPYHSCNGTNTAHRDHQFLFASGGESFYFFDLAGAGVVHVCGGAGAFVLSVFHKLELSKRGRRLQNVPLLRRRDTLGELKGDAQMKMRSRKLRPSRTSWRPDNILRNFVDWMYYRGTEEQENIESAALGVLILWTSWFCYTAGATEAISGKMAHAAVGRICTTICLAAASGGVTQAILSGLIQMASRHPHYNTNELANAVVASLVAVTGCCAFISPPWAIPIGCATVFIYHTGCFIEYCLGLHDGARVFPVHAVCGLWGLLCVGVFRNTCLVRELYENLCYCLNSDLPSSVDDQGRMILIQMGGGMFILLWSLVLVAILFAVMWYFPVKISLSCISYAFCGNDLKRGRLYFEGNLLFTHCGEIECPDLLTGTEHND